MIRAVVSQQADWHRPLIIAMVIALITQLALHFLQLRGLRRLKIKLALMMSTRYMRHLLSLPAVFYQQRYAGEVANRSALNDKLSTLLSGELAQTAAVWGF